MNAIWLTIREFVTSKKFIAAVAGILITLLAKLKFDIPESTVQEIVGLVMAYVLAQGWADSGKEAAKIQAVSVQAVRDRENSYVSTPATDAVTKIAGNVK